MAGVKLPKGDCPDGQQDAMQGKEATGRALGRSQFPARRLWVENGMGRIPRDLPIPEGPSRGGAYFH